MKLLVTGGAGFIGSHVAEAGLAAGHEVTVVDDLSTGHRRNLPPGAAFEQLDVREPAFSELIRHLRPDGVAHLAAQMDVRRSVADPVLDAEINVGGTVRLAEAARRAGTRVLVFASTGGAIYGEQETFPAGEDHPLRPVSPYGTAKLCAEEYLAYFERAGGPRSVCLRLANVYGPRQDPHGEAGVVAIFSRRMLAGQVPTLFGDGGQTRDYVFVGDVVRAFELALERPVSGAFNIGTGRETDLNRLARLLARACGFDGRPAIAAARPGEQRRSCIDPARAAAVLGWRAEVELERGLDLTVEHFRRSGEG